MNSMLNDPVCVRCINMLVKDIGGLGKTFLWLILGSYMFNVKSVTLASFDSVPIV